MSSGTTPPGATVPSGSTVPSGTTETTGPSETTGPFGANSPDRTTGPDRTTYPDRTTGPDRTSGPYRTTGSSRSRAPGRERAEAVGALARSDAIAAAARRGSRADQHVLDDAMIDAVRLQEEAGLDVITDGEVRRTTWAQTPRFLDCFTSFSVPRPSGPAFSEPGFNGEGLSGEGLSGQGPYGEGLSGQGLYRQGPYGQELSGPGATCPTVTGRVRDAARLGDMAADFASLTRYLNGRGDVPPRAKFTLPAPSYHRRYWSDERSKAAYSSVEEYLTEIRDYLREVVSRLIALGCDYIQLDAPNYGALCDPAVRARMASQGRDPMAELAFDAELDSSLLPGSLALDSLSHDGDGLTTALHICRNHDRRGHDPNVVADQDAGGQDASGYEAISAELFPRLRFDRLLLEYTPDQYAPNRYAPNRDWFEPLADVPPGTVVVLGLLAAPQDRLDPARLDTAPDRLSDGPSTGEGPNTCEGPTIEAAAEARIAEAARLKPLPELALSTRCGFATPSAQRTALEMVARVARRVWG